MIRDILFRISKHNGQRRFQFLSVNLRSKLSIQLFIYDPWTVSGVYLSTSSETVSVVNHPSTWTAFFPATSIASSPVVTPVMPGG